MVSFRRVFSSLCLGFLVLAGCGEKAASLVTGRPTPAFVLERLDRQKTDFPSQFAGKVVALRFWADWCPFCKSEMQAIEPVYQRLHSQGLEILAINVRQDRDTARAFLEQLDISYPALLDPQGDVARAYGVIGLPTTFVIDREGRLHTRIIGESTPELFERVVRELL